MPGALEGIRVVDLTAMFNGPIATMILGDQGADVVKIEVPGVGDVIRQYGVQRDGISGIFQAANRNKRSLAIDLRDPRGRDAVLRLIDRADVFLENFRPGVVERLGLDPAELRRRNPRLITASIRAFGSTGPLAQRPAFDSVIQAVSGMAAAQADEDGTPRLVQNAVCDKLTGLQVAQAITAALFARERSGQGQHLEVSMLDASLAFLWIDAMQDHVYIDPQEPAPRRSWPRPFATTDGYVMLSLITDPQFAAACRALGRDALATDPRFATIGERSRHMAELKEILAAACEGQTTEALCERLAAADVPHARVTRLEELADLPQVRANGSLVDLETGRCGRIRVPHPVERLEKTPSTIRRSAPHLGEHGDEVLAEAGLDEDERRALRDAGVLSLPG